MSKYRGEISQAEFERIERYLLGGMDDDERMVFEQEISSSSALYEEVALQRRLIATTELGAFFDRESHSTRVVEHSRGHKRIWLYAAAALLAFGFVGWWVLRPSVPTGPRLYVEYFYPDPGLPVTMSSTSQYVFYDGMVSYKEEKYDEAIRAWRTLPESVRSTDTLQYYLSMALLNKGELDSAALYLEPILTAEASRFHTKALWYRALIHVKREEYAEGVVLLRMLPPERRVTDILKKINQLE
ncbi:hypothetical protein [Parapedobacter pyrenivorans]|uniref:hypothetical protein n=1 Tax=Parapedobacter pyrenivorans TaxID=1305674 RepID=UPI00334057B7